MTTITVKNIPDEIYERLKLSARQSHRSINSEIIACIERSVRSQPVDPEQMIAYAQKLRSRTAAFRISDDEFNQMKSEGRQ